MPAWLAWALTFFFVNFSWVFFRAENISGAVRLLEGMLGLNGLGVKQEFARFVAYLSASFHDWGGLEVAGLLDVTGGLQFIVVFGFVALFCKNSIELVAEKSRFTIFDSVKVSATLFLTVLFGIASTSSVFLYFNF
jgi:hypothetical protein